MSWKDLTITGKFVIAFIIGALATGGLNWWAKQPKSPDISPPAISQPSITSVQESSSAKSPPQPVEVAKPEQPKSNQGTSDDPWSNLSTKGAKP